MIGRTGYTAVDPRSRLDDGQRHALTLRDVLPAVAQPRRASDNIPLVLGLLGALGLGALTLLGLDSQRQPPAPTDGSHDPVPAAVLAPATAPAVTAAPAAVPAEPLPVTTTANPSDAELGQSRGMPMIYDTSTGEAAGAPPEPGAPQAAPATAGLSGDELFAARAAGDAPPLAQARRLGDGRTTVVQGTILPAVLETAVNSDLPGYARALVSRDVRGFDGSRVLIPRGSRLVGQYKSGLAAGQSRAYIMWTRLIRPDGVSVQLGSPAMDEGGEIGLPGEVKRHFWQRFGGSILLSVVSGAASALGDGTSVVVAGSGANSAAGVALETDGKIPPTIRIAQGTPIQVFVARDLDFSGQADVPARSPPSTAAEVP